MREQAAALLEKYGEAVAVVRGTVVGPVDVRRLFRGTLACARFVVRAAGGEVPVFVAKQELILEAAKLAPGDRVIVVGAVKMWRWQPTATLVEQGYGLEAAEVWRDARA